MPQLRIETNISKDKIPASFFSKAIAILSKILGRPENLCVVSVNSDIKMNFGGSTEPCAIGNLLCTIGVLGVEPNKKISKCLFDLVEEELGVPQDKMFITFQDEPSSNVGYKGTTFHTIIG